MSFFFRLFSRKKYRDRPDGSEQRFLQEGQSPQHDRSGKLKFHKNDIECKVIHLDGQEMTTYLPKKALGRQLYDRVFTNFDFTQEFDYFGLQYMDTSNVAQWLDPTKKIKKQLSIGPPYTLHLKVRFFSSEPQTLRDELTRYLFVLQLKADILSGALKCDDELGSELAALCLQSELGDYDKEQHTLAFISRFRFMPEELQTEDFERSTLDHYAYLAGRNMTPAAADKAYLDKARYLPDYGVDMHCVMGKDDQTYRLGLTPTGILVYDNAQKIGFFFWPWIIKICFNKNKLKIIVAEKDDETGVTRDHSFVFSLLDPRSCKHLWKCCVECHSFFRLTCNNQGPVKGSAKLLRMQSRFYSSYRTEFEMRHASNVSSHRRSARFQRVPSKRFSSRASFEKAEVLGRKEGPRSKADKRAELKADTLRRLQQNDTTTTPAKEPSTPPMTAGDEAATIPRESLGSSVSSASRTHKTVVSVEAKVEAPPVPSRGSSAAAARSRTSSTSSSSSATSEEGEKTSGPLVARPEPSGGGDAVFEEPRTRLVPSHIPKSITTPARNAVTHASLRAAFKPTRLQEESTDDEERRVAAAPAEDANQSHIPILSRSSSAAATNPVLSQPQVSPGPPPPSQIPRQASVPSSSLPRPRPANTASAIPTPAPAAAIVPAPATAAGSRIPKIAGPTPTSTAPTSPPPISADSASPPPISAGVASSPPPISAGSASPRPISTGSASSPPPTSTGSASSPPPTSGAAVSMIPQPRRTSAAKPTGSRIPALVAQPPTSGTTSAPQRSASSASSSSSSSHSSTPPKELKVQEKEEEKEEKQEEKEEEEKEKKKEKDKDGPPPTRIPSLPRPPRGEVKTQFQVTV